MPELGVDDRLLTLRETARVFAVTSQTVQQWSDEGLIDTYRTLKGHRRYRLSDVQALIRSDRDRAQQEAEEAQLQAEARAIVLRQLGRRRR